MTRRRALWLGNLATVALLVGTSAIHAARHEYSYFGATRSIWGLAYLALLILMPYAFGLPDATDKRSPFATALVAAGAAALGISAVQLLTGDALLPRFVVFATAGGVVVSWTLIARAYRHHEGKAEEVDRVLFVGAHRDAAALEHDVHYNPERRAKVIGTVSGDDARPIGRRDEPLVDLAIDGDVNVLVLGRDVQNDRAIVSQASVLHESGVRVRSITDFYDEWLGKLPAFELQRMSLMFDIREVHEQGYSRLKRMLDIVAGIAATVVFGLVLPFVLLGNLFANRGSLFFRQERIGTAGQPFELVKFRTMRAGDQHTNWTEDDDPRITPFGRLLRKTHLDELPNCFNILRGELSIVGPRPEQPQYVESLAECLPFYRLRHLVRPGLTGWAQVKYGYAASEDDALEKLQYDFYYLQHQSLALDLRVMVRTLRHVAGADGR